MLSVFKGIWRVLLLLAPAARIRGYLVGPFDRPVRRVQRGWVLVMTQYLAASPIILIGLNTRLW